jgi:hypothetical protein
MLLTLRGALLRAGLVWGVCLLAAASACSKSEGGPPPTPGDAVFADGARLVARTVSFPGTEPLLVGVYDRAERTTCEFETAADGKLRCLPDAVPVPEPLDRWVEGVATPAGTSTAMTSGRLRRHDVVSADGGRFPYRLGIFDSRYEAPCAPSFVRNADGTAESICLPSAAYKTGWDFADAACSIPLAMMVTVDEPVLIIDAHRTLFALGAAWEGATYFPSGEACNENAPSTTRQFAIGATLPADAVATVRAVPRGDGRLGLQMVEADGGRLTTIRFAETGYPSSTDGPYFDRELGLACRPLWTVDQEVRCLPADASHLPGSVFADPGCTQPVVGAVPFAIVVAQDAVAGRQIGVEVRRVAATRSETAFTLSGSGSECTEIKKLAGYLLGDVVPLTDFAKLDARTGEEP